MPCMESPLCIRSQATGQYYRPIDGHYHTGHQRPQSGPSESREATASVPFVTGSAMMVLARFGLCGYHPPALVSPRPARCHQSSIDFQGELLVPYHARTASASRLTALAIIAVIIGLLLSALGPVMQASAAPVAAGFKDHSYGAGVVAPTEDKPQSKVWFADGFWWAGMFVDGSEDYRIHKYNASTHVWTATSTILDVRNSSHGDYLWDGATNTLYVASVNADLDVAPILVFKLNYNPTTDSYAHDAAFTSAGITVGTGPAETVTIAKELTSEQLWVTFQNPVDPSGATTTDRKVMVNTSSPSNQASWGTAFQVGTDTGPDDISAIVAFGGNAIGIMWSEHRPLVDPDSAFHFITHLDADADNAAAFSAPTSISGGSTFAEDHINIKLTTTASGGLLAALKTNGSPNHIQLYRRLTGGAWEAHVVVGGSQDVTRPQVVVDETNNLAYVFYTTPEVAGTGNQSIYYKSAPLSTLAFNTAGLGTPFIQDGVNDINDISTAKHNVTSATGLMAIASSDTNTSYYHGFLSLGPANREVVRVSGPNRFATAEEISKLRFPTPGASFGEVFIATGLNFPDALSAGPAANQVGAPILLVNQNSTPTETDRELDRLGPAKITIVGGTSQVSAAVQAQLGTYGATVERIAGTNRYDTAADVSLRFAANRPFVFIASGTGFPDALSAGPAASLLNVPILLTEQGTLPAETKTALNRLTPATIYVVGGTGVVSESVRNALAAYTDSNSVASVVRLSGADRFETNVDVVQQFWTTTIARSAVANGLNFPDALAEGAYDLPLHLVTPTSVPGVVATDIQRIDPDRIDALGGTTQISDGVLNTLRAL